MSEYGAGNPYDDNEFLTHYICESDPSLCYTDQGQWRLSRRGAYDTLPWTYNLGLSVAYNTTLGPVKLNAKFEIQTPLPDIIAQAPGCWQKGFQQVKFKEIDTHNGKNWTVFLGQ